MAETSQALVLYNGPFDYFQYIQKQNPEIDKAKDLLSKLANFHFYAVRTYFDELYINNPTHKLSTANRSIVFCVKITSPLSYVWDSNTSLMWKFIAYPLGMIGYTASCASRVLNLVLHICILVAKILSCSVKFQDIVLTAHRVGICFLEILTSLVGIICPPLGYFLDRKVDMLADREKKGVYYTLEIPLTEALEALEFSPDANLTKQELTKKRNILALKYHSDKARELQLPDNVRREDLSRGVIEASNLLVDYFKNPTLYLQQFGYDLDDFFEEKDVSVVKIRVATRFTRGSESEYELYKKAPSEEPKV